MAGPRSLLPREHGAYAELSFPLASALLAALVTPGGSLPAVIGFGVAAIGLFLLNEPVLLLLGYRGTAARREEGSRARRMTLLLILVAISSGLLALGAAPAAALRMIWVPLAFAALLLPLVLTGREKTLPGEILAVGAFSAAAIPIALAGAVAVKSAWTLGLVWFVSFTLGTLAVHAVKARSKPRPGNGWKRVASPLAAMLAAAGSITLAAAGATSWLPALAIVVVACTTLALDLAGVGARHMKRIGWSMAAVNSVAFVLLMIAVLPAPAG